MDSVAATLAPDYVLSFYIYLIFGLCIFVTVLSGTTDGFLQSQVYSAVITELKLFSNSYICFKSSTYVKLIGIIINNLDHASHIFCLILF